MNDYSSTNHPSVKGIRLSRRVSIKIVNGISGPKGRTFDQPGSKALVMQTGR